MKLKGEKENSMHDNDEVVGFRYPILFVDSDGKVIREITMKVKSEISISRAETLIVMFSYKPKGVLDETQKLF